MSDEGADDTLTAPEPGCATKRAPHSALPGDVLNGKYRVERVLGQGGMGVVLAAEHLELNERVALKLMLPEALASTEAVARFLTEARATVKIKGEHVARVLDVGKLDDGEPYIVMEYLEGTDLSALLDKSGPLSIKKAIDYLLQACEAIAEAHAIGIIHRDLKPSNLFLAQRPDGSARIKVLDFGISKIVPRGRSDDPVALSMTRTRQALGTPYYMPPEQMESARKADMTSDIWSLGAILFELLTGSVPFDASTLSELRRKIRTEPAPELRLHRKSAPQEIEEVIKRCLEKDPAKRYQNVAELSVALSPFASTRMLESVRRICRIIDNAGLGTTVPLHALPPESEPAPDSLLETSAKARADLPPRRARRIFAAGLGLLAAVLAGSAALFALRQAEEPRPPDALPLPAQSAPDAAETAQPVKTAAEPAASPPPATTVAADSAPPRTPQDAPTHRVSATATAGGDKRRPKAAATTTPSPSSSPSPVLTAPDPLDAQIH
jgi:serine/threonine protein kinase